MMPPGPNPYNPYWNGMQPGMDAFMGPYGGGVPYIGSYGLGPMDIPFGGMYRQNLFGVSGGLLMPPFIPPQRDLTELGMGMKCFGPPVMSRDEFEARRAEMKRKCEFDNQGGTRSSRELPKEHEFSREGRGHEDGPPVKSKTRLIPTLNSDGHRHRSERQLQDHSQQHKSHRRSESSSTKRQPQAPPDSKPVAAAQATETSAISDRKHKPNVFSCISFPEVEAAAASKKHKFTSNSSKVASGGGPAAATASIDYDSRDDDRHFKRRTLRYESSPARKRDHERDRDRERDREHYRKHR